MTHFARHIRDIRDFPKPGIVFKDITPMLSDAAAFAQALDAMAAPWRDAGVEFIAGIEARGFIFGAALASLLECGFVPLRKPGKLPAECVTHAYSLEYGEDQLCAHADAVKPGQRVLLVDDVLATGGTLAAARELLHKLEADCVGAAVLIELAFLQGRAKLPADFRIEAALSFSE